MAAVCENCKKEGLNRPGIDPDNFEYGHDVMVSLEIAAADGHPDCLRAIIDAAADVNYVNKGNLYTAVMWAARYGHPECMELLIKAGADVNKTECRRTPLWFASCFSENPKCVELLLEAGADVNRMDREGTALMRASCSGHKDTVDVLIKAGADVNLTDEDGTTAFMLAANSPNGWKCMKSLVKAGADVNAVCDGKSVLMWGIFLDDGNDKSVEELVKLGADVNATDEEDSNTSLHMTVNKEDRSFEILMAAGADVNIKNKRGHTPLVIVDLYNTERAEALIEAGAEIPENILFDEAYGDSANGIRLYLRHGVKVNQRNAKGHNALEHYLTASMMTNKEVCMLLHAAGESLRKVGVK